MALSQTTVIKLYNAVVEDVIAGVRDCFLDEGVDEQVLHELRQIWKAKLTATGAAEPPPELVEPPPIIQNFQKANGNAAPKKSAASHQHVEPQASGIASGVAQHQAEAASSAHASGPAAPPALDPSNRVAVQLTMPAQPGVPNSHRVFTIQIPAAALQGNRLHQILTGPIISATMNLPQPLAATLLQQHINAALAGGGAGAGGASKGGGALRSLDGADDTSDEEGSGAGSAAGSDAALEDDMSDEEEDARGEEEEEEGADGPEDEPLNSGDDVSDEEPGDMFDTDNVVVCQYDKITRSRNKWKFYLKDGIMNLTGKDFVFQKANGDAEW